VKRIGSALMAACLAGAGATPASAFLFQVSVGQGALISPRSSSVVANTVSASPLTTEILLGYNVRPWLTVDLGLLFAYDVFDPYYGSAFAKSYYVGARPGIHAFLGTPRVGLRPYLRAAFPIQYDNAAGRTAVGLLVGGGIEYKLGMIGVFAEAIVSPYFNYENLIPLEGRLGVALHF
jgi:hypothetical protein